MGLKRRQYLPRRAFAGAAFLSASGSRMGALPDSNQEPVYVRIGHAPWWRNYGRPGETIGVGGAEGWDLIRSTSYVGTAALGCPLGRAEQVFDCRTNVELCSTGQPRVAVLTF